MDYQLAGVAAGLKGSHVMLRYPLVGLRMDWR
jgi:hypothetical protein